MHRVFDVLTDIGYHFEFGKYVTWYILSKKSKLQNEDVPFLLNIDTSNHAIH